MLASSLMAIAVVISIVHGQDQEDPMKRLEKCGKKAECHYNAICAKLGQDSAKMIPIKDKCVKMPPQVATVSILHCVHGVRYILDYSYIL